MNEIALCIKNQLRIDGLTQTNSPQVLRIQNTKLDYNEHKASYLKLPTDSNRKPSFLSRVFLLLPFLKTRWMTQSLPSNSPFLLSPAFLLLPSFSSSSRNDIVAYQSPCQLNFLLNPYVFLMFIIAETNHHVTRTHFRTQKKVKRRQLRLQNGVINKNMLTFIIICPKLCNI